MIVSRTELAESLGINPKTVDRLRGTVFLQVNDGERRPDFDLAASVQAFAKYQSQKKRDKQAATVDGSDELMLSVLRRWRSKVGISRQALDNHREQYLDHSDLSGLWGSIVGRAVAEIERLPRKIANLAKGVEDIASVSEIIRQQVYATLTRLSKSDDDGYLDSLPADAEDAEIEAPEGADVSDLIEIERTRHNNLVSELNERRAEVAAGQLVDLEMAKGMMGQMVGIARAKLLTLAGGFARLIAAQERADIVKILADEIEVITSELKPVLSVPKPNVQADDDEEDES
jgi:hypothetical protein